MKIEKFIIGQRVKISEDCHWAKSTKGTIGAPPYHMVQGYKGISRIVDGVKGPIKFYFVEFDFPQYDADGDGPYKGGEIAEKYLMPL